MKRYTMTVDVLADGPLDQTVGMEIAYWIAKSPLFVGLPTVTQLSVVPVYVPPKVGEKWKSVGGHVYTVVAVLGKWVVTQSGGSEDRPVIVDGGHLTTAWRKV